MGIALLKFLRWYISAACFILGVYFLQLSSDTDSIRPIAGVVMTFGIVFWLSKTTYEAPKNIFIASIGVLVAAGLVARFFVSTYFDIGYYSAWMLCATLIGLPVMIYVFMKFDE